MKNLNVTCRKAVWEMAAQRERKIGESRCMQATREKTCSGVQDDAL